MRLPSDPPRPGEWFCLPQSVVLVDKYNLDKEHRWIVAGSGVIKAKVPALLRSTKSGYGGIQHEAHNGTCGSATCQINELGWISDLEKIGASHFKLERRSCYEPCEEIIEKVMQRADHMDRSRRTRKSR